MSTSKYFQTLCWSLCFAAFFVSCKKDKINVDGQGSAFINGAFWSGEARAHSNYDKINLSIETYKKIEGTLVPWESLGLFWMAKQTHSKQRITNGDSVSAFSPWAATTANGFFGTSQDDGCIPCDYYRIIDTDTIGNWVKLNRQRDNYNEVWGSYNMHLYRKQTCNTSPYSDTLVIYGEFHFILQ
jgi:hypothetical protein